MSSIISSISRQGAYEPFELQVSRGQIAGHRALTVFGYNADIDTAEETVWPDGGIAPRPAAALQMKVSSSDANDASAGTGARTVVVAGLDANYNEITEVVTLNGQTAVTTTASFLRVNSLTVATAGSGLANAGVIYIGTGVVTAGVPATIYNLIAVGYNVTTSALYTVPANYTAYVLAGGVTAAQVGGTNPITAKLVTTPASGIRYAAAVTTLNNGVNDYMFVAPIVVAEKTDLEATAIGKGSNNEVSAFFNLILIKNNGQV